MQLGIDHTENDHPPDFDVIVVGFGPAGAVATCSLGQVGLRTLALDKSEDVWEIPRAVAIDHEILRLFQNIGVAEEVLKFTAPFPASQHFGAKGQLIRRIDAVPPPYPMGYVPTMVFTQPPVEAVLRKRAGEFANVSIYLGARVVGVSQTKEKVTLEVEGKDGRKRFVTASYVIACDGASSTIRQLLGMKLHDLGFDEPWMVIDVMIHDSALAKLPDTAAQYCDPARPTTFIIGPGNHRRWEIMLLPGEDPRSQEESQNVWGLLAPWITPEDGKLWRASSYRFHALVAEQWRDGRVFLAGDAAHQQPPFIGQGMCQGIRDVTNLSWKLRSVIKDGVNEELLNSYAVERGQHVRTLTARIKAIGHAICERDPEAAERRDDLLLKDGGGVAPTITRQEIVPPLEAGLLSPFSHVANGVLFPQPWILRDSGRSRLDELTGTGWRFIVDGRKADEEVFGAMPIPTCVVGGAGLRETDDVVGAWFDRHSCMAAVVRPDHYVYGVVSSPGEAQRLMDTLKPIFDPAALPLNFSQSQRE